MSHVIWILCLNLSDRCTSLSWYGGCSLDGMLAQSRSKHTVIHSWWWSRWLSRSRSWSRSWSSWSWWSSSSSWSWSWWWWWSSSSSSSQHAVGPPFDPFESHASTILFNPLALELDNYSLAHHLCKMWIFYEPRRATSGNTRHFVEG